MLPDTLTRHSLADPRVRRLGAYARAVATSRRRAAYLGWLNHDNMGDEAMLAAYRQAFPRCDLVEVPERIARLGGPARRLAASRALVLGGGTLIGHAAYRQAYERLKAAAPAAPSVMLGTGVEDPAFHGARQQEMREELRRWAEILHGFVAVDVRGPASQELLAGVGVDARVVGDSARLLGPKDLPPAGSERILGVNLSLGMEMWGGRPDRVLEAIGGALRELSDGGWRIRYVPLWPADIASARELERILGREIDVVEGFLDLPTLLESLAPCRVFVGQKLHSVVLASAVHVPSVMLEYHPKCGDFQRSIDRERWTLRTDAVSRRALTSMVEELDADHDAQRAQVHSAVAGLRARLDESVERSRQALPPDLR
jgi:polysaccharide pyruvyl transferase WcaK-like protein